jgi:hypothetical protein
MSSEFSGCKVTAWLAVLAAIFCFVARPAAAQKLTTDAADKMASHASPPAPTPMSTDGHPDLTGLWWSYRGVNLDVKQDGNTRVNLQPTSRAPESEDPDNNLSVNTRIYDTVAARRASPDKPSYKPEMMAKVARLDRIEAKVDPAMHCQLPGIIRSGPPQQIVQGPGVVVFLYDSPDASYDAFRIIPTDGHPHRTAEQSNGLSPSYMGDSIGRWDGDTLVVDTIDFNGEVWLGIDGWFTSTKLHVTERLRREGDFLHYQATVDDPEVLTKPWVMLDSAHVVTPEHH